MPIKIAIGGRIFLATLLLAGCSYPVRDLADLSVEKTAARQIDLEPRLQIDKTFPADTTGGRLKLPPGLPGTNAKPIELPDPTSPDFEKKKKAALEKLYPELPALGPDAKAKPGPNGKPMPLMDLQRLAMNNSPLIRQAAADVEAARGAVIQAGAYPNPTIGYEADTMGTANTAGYQGGFIEQLIKTGGKLKLAEAAARMDLFNAELALRRAQTDLTAQVRSGYFAVLVARESVRINTALVQFTDAIFRIQVDQVKAGAAATAAPYEPMQLRVLAFQARANLIQSRNRYVSAWQQLVAAIGLPGMPLTELAGRVDMPIPVYSYAKVLGHVLTMHTDVSIAQNSVLKARYNLRLAQVTPIPDVDVRLMVQRDFTTPPFNATSSIAVSIPVPVWNNNKGGIIQAQGQLLRSNEEAHRVRSDLTQKLADAFERYDNTRRILEYYKNNILPDQVRVYKGVYDRHQQKPDEVSFGDIVTAQQTLVNALGTYVSTLGSQWQAVIDVANLLQTNDLFQLGKDRVETQSVTPIPDLAQLAALTCYHRHSPLKDSRLLGANGQWPAPIAADRLHVPKMPKVNGKVMTNGKTRPKKEEPLIRKFNDVEVLTPE